MSLANPINEEQMQTLCAAIDEHTNAVDKVVALYDRKYITAPELCEKIAALQAEYDRKTAEIFKL